LAFPVVPEAGVAPVHLGPPTPLGKDLSCVRDRLPVGGASHGSICGDLEERWLVLGQASVRVKSLFANLPQRLCHPRVLSGVVVALLQGLDPLS
jgi:hypothetical protein